MSGYYLFFRLCSNLNSTFPAKKLDEVRDKDLPSALAALAREWLEQHPGAVATVEEVTKLLTLGDDPAESYEVDLLRWGIDEFRRELGIHPDQPLFLRVAPLAGWGFPLPQPLFGGQVVSERCFFARAPDRRTAESALKYIRRLAAKPSGGDWLKPHFGCCAESGFTKEERKTIEITYDQVEFWFGYPDFVQSARRVLDSVVNVMAEVEAHLAKDEDSAWVSAISLWRDRFSSRKKMQTFRKKHPEMFRNPSTYKLEIHSGLWARYWARHDRAGFEALGEETPSIADDPEVQEAALASAVERAASLRAKKKAGE